MNLWMFWLLIKKPVVEAVIRATIYGGQDAPDPDDVVRKIIRSIDEIKE